MNMESIDNINTIADASFPGIIEGHVTHFYGLCPECKKKNIVEKTS